MRRDFHRVATRTYRRRRLQQLLSAPAAMLRASVMLPAIAALIVGSCGDGPATPQPDSLTGRLRISIVTSGTFLDPDGYRIVVNSAQARPVGHQGFVVVEKLAAGTYVVALEGVAANCTVTGTNLRTITLDDGGTGVVDFAVVCAPTGIELRTRTTGPDQPFDGYLLSYGQRTSYVSTNGTAVLGDLGPGNYTFVLSVAENCSVVGSISTTVTVVERTVTPVTFDIACVRTDKRIAFVRVFDPSRNGIINSVVVADDNGRNVVALASGTGPAWSPDGSRLAYSTADCDFYYGCYGGLAIVDVLTGSSSIPAYGDFGFDPSWSPNGEFIAFSYFTGNFPATLRVTRISDSQTALLSIPNAHARNPAWSADGQRLVFECDFPNPPGPTVSDICTINRDGSAFTRLTNDPALDLSPTWSPDGSKIAFTTHRFTALADVAVMSSTGTGLTRLTSGSDPEWSRDGTRLLIARADGLFTIGSDGSTPTRITTGLHRAPARRP